MDLDNYEKYKTQCIFSGPNSSIWILSFSPEKKCLVKEVKTSTSWYQVDEEIRILKHLNAQDCKYVCKLLGGVTAKTKRAD